MKKIILFIALIFAFSACTELEATEVEEETVGQSVCSDLFQFSIVVLNPQPEKGEAVICYTLVTYVGDEPITIYHSSPLVTFGIEDNEYFTGEYCRNDVLCMTSFEPNEEKRFDFEKNGSWSEDDPNASFYKEFYSQSELILPEGEYEISANIEFSTDEDDILGSKESMTASVEVKAGG